MLNSSLLKNKGLNYFFALFVILIWGITFVSTKYLLRSFSAFEILIVRFITAYTMLCLMKPERIKLPRKKDEWWFFAAGASGVSVYQFLENIAIDYTLPANVCIIVSICPMFTAIIAQIFLKEKNINLLFVVGFLLAISGIVFVTFNGALVFHLSPKGDFLALAAAVCWAFYSLSVTKIASFNLSPISSTRRQFFWALVCMIPIAVFGILNGKNSPMTYINLSAAANAERWSDIFNWLNFGFLGIAASAFAFAVWNFVCKNLGTVRVTVFLYLTPVVTIVFAFLILGDKITLMGSIGAVLTIAGLAISEASKRKEKGRRNIPNER